MFFQRLYDDKLAQASYLVGSESGGEAIVIDPNRDADQYVRAATAAGLRITHVTETHIHADFVSGSRELVRRTGAALYLSAEGGEAWQYLFAAGDGAKLLRNGDVIEVGRVRLDVQHTPGHTPEHLSFLVTDTANADRPIGVFTGDFVFMGDVGRPDLLERAAKLEGTMDDAARLLFAGLQRFKGLPDYLQVWPGHGAGSACGKSLGAVPQTTVGYETRFNWAFGVAKEAEFVRRVLEGQPDPPKYFAEMKRVNRDGPRILDGFTRPPIGDAVALREAIAAGAVVIDTRPTAQHAAGHVPRTLNVPFVRTFTTRAGLVVPYGRDIFLVIGDGGEVAADIAAAAARDLALIGFDRVSGYFDASALSAWQEKESLESTPQINAGELAGRLKESEESVAVIDVRDRSEWDAGHIPGAEHVPLGQLSDRVTDLDRNKPLVLHCESGSRSAIGASLLRAHGFTNVINLSDGFAGWQRRGLPVDKPTPESPPLEPAPV